MCNCPDVKMEFCFAIIKSIVAVKLKTINNTRAEFFMKHIFKTKLVENLTERFGNDIQFTTW